MLSTYCFCIFGISETVYIFLAIVDGGYKDYFYDYDCCKGINFSLSVNKERLYCE